MSRPLTILSAVAMIALCAPAMAQEAMPAPASYDPALAQELGADKRGVRAYVLAILKTGPRDAEITDPEHRATLFAGHFANITKLAEAGQLVLAGPLGGEDGRRGLFILNVPDIEAARALVATDPTVEAGIFTVDYSRYYGSAGLMTVNALHARIQAPQD